MTIDDPYNFNNAPAQRPAEGDTLPESELAASGERFVDTGKAKAAVLGHESQLVATLGLGDAVSRSDHKTCPLTRRHPNDRDPSFRIDPDRWRAFCSCISNWHPKGGKTLDIWGLIQEIKGLTFSDAKVWAMEQLGRSDLIQTKGKKSHASTIADLLAPAPHLRDDSLVANYLRFRLGGVDPPRPTTPIAGWRSLGYYDPPPQGEKKPIKVGDWPCAVFGTVDIEGAVHAHRIYLAPGGHGKADLPPLPNGNARDVKKSAWADRVRTSGLGVVWGSLATALWIIVAEGIETACAVAVAFADEIKLGSLAVVSAISDSGVAAFRPGPNCKRVIVAADRDDLKSGAGERAARQFCTRNHDKLESGAGYALPGDPGTNTDWLDVFVADGAEAVKSGILAAQKFEPTSADIEDAAKSELRLIEKFDLEGNYRPIHTNGVILLGRLLGDRLGVDTFAQKITCKDDPPFPWRKENTHPLLEREIDDAFNSACMMFLQNSNCFIRSAPMVDQILGELARRRTYHSFQRYLKTCELKPDRVWPCNIETFLEVVLGVAPFGPIQELWDDKDGRWTRALFPDELAKAALHQKWVRAESKNLFLRIVARGKYPGIKADEALNIVGPENIGKSKVIRALGEPWYTDQLPKLNNKDALIQIAGILVLEIGDGTHVERTNPADLKNFLSAQDDRYRGVFGRRAEDHPRTTVFVVTTNNYENLTSTTGNRRLPTMEARWARPELLTDDFRRQLFAEADAALGRGDKHYLTDAALIKYAAGVATEHVEESAYEEAVAKWIDGNSVRVAAGFTLDEVFAGIGINDLDLRDKATKKVGKALNKLGYQRGVKWIDGKSARRWIKAQG